MLKRLLIKIYFDTTCLSKYNNPVRRNFNFPTSRKQVNLLNFLQWPMLGHNGCIIALGGG